jgi:hypothetical protein
MPKRKKREKIMGADICWIMSDEEVVRFALQKMKKYNKYGHLQAIIENRIVEILSRTVFDKRKPFGME